MLDQLGSKIKEKDQERVLYEGQLVQLENDLRLKTALVEKEETEEEAEQRKELEAELA